MTKYTMENLKSTAGAVAIWDGMAALAVTTAQPGDGRADAFKETADKFRAEFDRLAKEINATPEQLAQVNEFVQGFKDFARQQFAEQATTN